MTQGIIKIDTNGEPVRDLDTPVSIVSADIGDDDCRKMVWDVWQPNGMVEGGSGHPTYAQAALWAKEIGYKVNPQ